MQRRSAAYVKPINWSLRRSLRFELEIEVLLLLLLTAFFCLLTCLCQANQHENDKSLLPTCMYLIVAVNCQNGFYPSVANDKLHACV